MLSIADAALYAVKEAGRDGWLGAIGVESELADALLTCSRQPFLD